jgi:hypothetical protein
MPKFGKRSKENLATTHPDLQELFNEVIKHFDCSIICGHRGIKEQNEAYSKGLSKLKYPLSKHNKRPSKAVDVVPYPIDWGDKKRMYYFAGVVKGIAIKMGINIRWGGDWDSDTEIKDNSFIDLPHYEIKN